ncbi:uncharacterized protein [Oscarella lobularis]|uniref:uncharacterized protein isoform X3 n=1 Tax=Oscarella lobularis TaxID=121494 RepID=UPI003313AC3C
MSREATREQQLVLILAANIIAKRLPLQRTAILSIVEELRRRGVTVPPWRAKETALEDDDHIKARLFETTKVLRAFHMLLTARNNERRDLFSVLCSALHVRSPRVWQECLFSFNKELSDEELTSVYEANVFDPFSLSEDSVSLCTDVESCCDEETVIDLSREPKGILLCLDSLSDVDIEVFLRSIWEQNHSMIAVAFRKETEESRMDCKRLLWKILNFEKDLTRLQSSHESVRSSPSNISAGPASLHSLPGKTGNHDCMCFLWSILQVQKDVKRLRKLAHVKIKCVELSAQSRMPPSVKHSQLKFDERLHAFCFEEIGQYWLPLGLRLGFSKNELSAIGDEFDEYGDEYKALAMMREHAMSVQDASFNDIRTILQETKQQNRASWARERSQRKIRSNMPNTDGRIFGRDSELEKIGRFFWGSKIRESFVSPISHKLQFICGVGGVGKTKLALQYAARQEKAYQRGVVCVDAQSLMTIEASLQEYFLLAAARGEGNYDAVAGRSIQQLFSLFYESVNQSNRVLILFDNADDLDAVGKYLPRRFVSCHVLVTTRTTEASELFSRENSNVIVLEALEGSTAVSALISLAGKDAKTMCSGELEAARKIAVLSPVEGLPIALRHVSAYLLRHESVTFEAYWEKLVTEERQLEAASLDLDQFLRYFRLSHMEEVLRRIGIKTPSDLLRLKSDGIDLNSFDRKSLDNAVQKLYTTRHAFLTWEMDITDVEENFPVAFSILLSCSVMASRSIPQEIISNCLSIVHGNSAPLRLVEGLGSLKKYTLLTRDIFNDGRVCYAMHHLIHRSVFERLRQNKALMNYVLHVAGVCLERVLDREIEFIFGIAAHCYSVAKNMLELGMVPSDAGIISRAVELCLVHGHMVVLESLASMVVVNVNRRSDLSESKRLEILRTYHLNLSTVAGLRGDTLEADEHYRRAFRDRGVEDFSDDEVIRFSRDLIHVADRSENLQDAEAILNRLVVTLEKEEEDFRSAYVSLAGVLLQSGQKEKYEDLLMFLFSLSASRSNPVETVIGLYCLGHCRFNEQKFDGALECFKQVIHINETSRTSILKPIEVCKAHLYCFVSCKRTRQFEFGHQILEKGLPILQSRFFFTENLTSILYNALYGSSLYTLKKYTKAVDHLQQCLSVCPRSRDGEIQLMLIVWYLGMSLAKLGKLDEAVMILKEFSYLFERLMVNNQWINHTDFSMMVKLYTDAEKWDDAIFLLKSCFLNCKEKHGWSLSYSSLHATWLLCECLLAKGLFKDAHEVSAKALRDYDPKLFPDYRLLEKIHELKCAVGQMIALEEE